MTTTRSSSYEYSKEELVKLANQMEKVADTVYWLFFHANMGGQVHAFIEFCGLLNKYTEICKRCAEQGIDFTMLNTHSRQALPVEGHDVEYLVEKLDCIFGPIIRANPETRAAFAKLLEGA
jgi:hypothetical protein